VCLDGERISVRIVLFELVVEISDISGKYEKSVNFYDFGLVKCCLERYVKTVERIVKIINYF
jgi:hypothetical protein